MKELSQNKWVRRLIFILTPICIVQSIVIIGILQIIAVPTWYNHQDIFLEMPDWVYLYTATIMNFGSLFIVMFIMILGIVMISVFPKTKNMEGNVE